MSDHGIIRGIFKILTKYKILSIGTKYFPTTPLEIEYVDMFNFTKTMLLEVQKAEITTESIFYNLVRDVGEENIPQNHKFYELKPAENKIEEYALVSNIIMGSDRYLYVELSAPHSIISTFSKIIQDEHGSIVEQSSTEIVSRLLSKNDAIRVAIKLVGLGLNNDINVRASVGMTGAAAIERSINLNKEVGNVSGIGFTKLGGEYALVLDTKFLKSQGSSSSNKNYLFIDMVDSTNFINKKGRDKLVELMESIKKFIETECNGKIEGYRPGGDDLIAEFPSKDLAIRAGLDSAWFVLNNGAKIRAGVGKSRREAGERAQFADEIQIQSSLSLVIFELANGTYAYYIPSEFIRTILNFTLNKKSKIIAIFAFVFITTFILIILGLGQLSFLPVILAAIYALIS